MSRCYQNREVYVFHMFYHIHSSVDICNLKTYNYSFALSIRGNILWQKAVMSDTCAFVECSCKIACNLLTNRTFEFHNNWCLPFILNIFISSWSMQLVYCWVCLLRFFLFTTRPMITWPYFNNILKTMQEVHVFPLPIILSWGSRG